MCVYRVAENANLLFWNAQILNNLISYCFGYCDCSVAKGMKYFSRLVHRLPAVYCRNDRGSSYFACNITTPSCRSGVSVDQLNFIIFNYQN